MDGFRWDTIAYADRLGTFLQHAIKRHVFQLFVGRERVHASGVENLIDQKVEAVEIFQHVLVEAGSLLVAHLTPAQGLQAEFHGRNRRLELVGHTVEEIRLPLVEIDRLDGEDEINNHAGQESGDKDRAHGEQRPVQPGKTRVRQRSEDGQ